MGHPAPIARQARTLQIGLLGEAAPLLCPTLLHQYQLSRAPRLLDTDCTIPRPPALGLAQALMTPAPRTLGTPASGGWGWSGLTCFSGAAGDFHCKTNANFGLVIVYT